MMKYRVIHVAIDTNGYQTLEDFEKTVTEHLQNGWQLVGNAIYTAETKDRYPCFTQTLVKYEQPTYSVKDALFAKSLSRCSEMLYTPVSNEIEMQVDGEDN